MFDAGTNNNSAITSTLTSMFVNGTNESGVSAYANIKALSSFFDTVTYIGAVKDASDTWYKGWTCDNADAQPELGQQLHRPADHLIGRLNETERGGPISAAPFLA